MYVIDIGYQTPDVTMGEQLAVLSCQGLMNRENIHILSGDDCFNLRRSQQQQVNRGQIYLS